MKKAACFVAGFSLAVCLAAPAGAVWDADYGESMIECALAGDRERGLLYERLRNAKVDALELEAQHIKYRRFGAAGPGDTHRGRQLLGFRTSGGWRWARWC